MLSPVILFYFILFFNLALFQPFRNDEKLFQQGMQTTTVPIFCISPYIESSPSAESQTSHFFHRHGIEG
jgi:hypothetical protein